METQERPLILECQSLRFEAQEVLSFSITNNMITRKIKAKETREINWAIPDQKVTHDEFKAAIGQAEKGPFYTIRESMHHFEQWLKSRKKK